MKRNHEREEELREQGLVHCHVAADIIERTGEGLVGFRVHALIDAYRSCDPDKCGGNGMGAVMLSLRDAAQADAILALFN